VARGAARGACAAPAWRIRGVSVTSYQQKAELPDSKDAMPDESKVNAQVVPDVVLRVPFAVAAFFRRLRAGHTPADPRFHGRDRDTTFTYPHGGDHGGARRDKRVLVFSKIGRIAEGPYRRGAVSPRGGTRPLAGLVRWRDSSVGAYKPVTISREADGW
jgi:hypothetical protein